MTFDRLRYPFSAIGRTSALFYELLLVPELNLYGGGYLAIGDVLRGTTFNNDGLIAIMVIARFERDFY